MDEYTIQIEMEPIQVYMAGPCFSSADRLWNIALKLALEECCQGMGLTFYLPQQNVDEKWSSKLIQHELVHGLVQSQAVVANLDGPSGDDGTCWEMGFTSGRSSVREQFNLSPQHVFWYRTDFRRGGDSDQNVNLMMAHGAKQIEVGNDQPGVVALAIREALATAFEISHRPPQPTYPFAGQPPNCS